MAAKKADMQRLLEQRDQLLREIEALRNKVAGLEMAIALLDEEGSNKTPKTDHSGREKRSVKRVVLDFLEEVGTTGLNAATAVEIANRRGITLDRGTVSSLLSRLKRDEIAVFDGHMYRLKKFAPPPKASDSQQTSLRVIATGE